MPQIVIDHTVRQLQLKFEVWLVCCEPHAQLRSVSAAYLRLLQRADRHMFRNLHDACCNCRHIRHPGYLGWFIWAVGTQFLLVNPVSIAVFAYVVSTVVPHWHHCPPAFLAHLPNTMLMVRLAYIPLCLQSWSFFNQRIATEEWYLTQFFGASYIEYAQQTPTYIPFIK